MVVDTPYGKAHITKAGYLKIHTRNQYRDQYVHRVVANEAWMETFNVPLPTWYEVHHINWDKTDFSRCNLLILDKRLHEYFSMEYSRKQRAKKIYGNRWIARREYAAQQQRLLMENIPDWVLDADEQTNNAN